MQIFSSFFIALLLSVYLKLNCYYSFLISFELGFTKYASKWKSFFAVPNDTGELIARVNIYGKLRVVKSPPRSCSVIVASSPSALLDNPALTAWKCLFAAATASTSRLLSCERELRSDCNFSACFCLLKMAALSCRRNPATGVDSVELHGVRQQVGNYTN